MIDTYDSGSTTHTLHLSIANLVFNICSQNLPLLLEYDTSYKQFLVTQNDPSAVNIDISLDLKETLPDISSITRIFETPESWYMLSDSNGKYIVFQPPNNPKIDPVWLARIDSDLRHIDVFCDKVQLTDGSNMEGIANPVRYPLDQILLINCLLGKGLLIHSAGIIINDRGYLFAGPSGAGKSTICSIFQELKQYAILSDDRMVVRKSGHDLLMYGTPWPGEAGIAVNDSAVLQGIFFLTHSNENRIKELAPQESLDNFFKVASLPWYDKNDLQKSLDFCEDLLQQVKMYELNFRPGPEIVEDIISFVSG